MHRLRPSGVVGYTRETIDRFCPELALHDAASEWVGWVEIRRSFQRYDWRHQRTVPARDIAPLHGLDRRTDMRKGPR
jgi:hypothetical protein